MCLICSANTPGLLLVKRQNLVATEMGLLLTDRTSPARLVDSLVYRSQKNTVSLLFPKHLKTALYEEQLFTGL